MRNKLLVVVLFLSVHSPIFAQDAADARSDSSSVIDSVISKTHTGPLGMDDLTGMTLYLVGLLLLVLCLFLWRRRLAAQRISA
jgi:hypothetical protein